MTSPIKSVKPWIREEEKFSFPFFLFRISVNMIRGVVSEK